MNKKTLVVIIIILIVILVMAICFAVHVSIKTQTPENTEGTTTSPESHHVTEASEEGSCHTEKETVTETIQEPAGEETLQTTQPQGEEKENLHPTEETQKPTEDTQDPIEIPQDPTKDTTDATEDTKESSEQTDPGYAPGDGGLPVMPLD